jgi:hypothetical protein
LTVENVIVLSLLLKEIVNGITEPLASATCPGIDERLTGAENETTICGVSDTLL